MNLVCMGLDTSSLQFLKIERKLSERVKSQEPSDSSFKKGSRLRAMLTIFLLLLHALFVAQVFNRSWSRQSIIKHKFFVAFSLSLILLKSRE